MATAGPLAFASTLLFFSISLVRRVSIMRCWVRAVSCKRVLRNQMTLSR